jgi:hypothetical protein
VKAADTRRYRGALQNQLRQPRAALFGGLRLSRSLVTGNSDREGSFRIHAHRNGSDCDDSWCAATVIRRSSRRMAKAARSSRESVPQFNDRMHASVLLRFCAGT